MLDYTDMSNVRYTLELLLPYVRRIEARGNIDYRLFAENLWSQLEKAEMPGVHKSNSIHAATGRRFQYDVFSVDLKNATAEAWFYLFRSGYMTPAAPDDYLSPPNLSRMDVTSRGLEWFKGGEPIPEDAQSYIEFLSDLVPSMDPVIKQYIEESLVAFNREAFFAAAVMVGAASEKAVYLLAESMLFAFIDPRRRDRLEVLLTKQRKLEALLDMLSKLIQEASIPYKVGEGSEHHLFSLFDSIRVQRNDAVHPKEGIVSPDSVRLTILAFPRALAKSEQLRAWFTGNPESI